MKHMQRQSGSVLIISLIVMLVLTILGVSGMKSAVLEEKMAGNVRNTHLAFEATLREAEQYIEDNIVSVNNFDTDGSDGLYDKSQQKLWNNINWDSSDSIEYTNFDTSYSVKTPPRYVIEHLATNQDNLDTLNLDNYGQGTGAGRVELFLITARATGSSGNNIVLLQATYGKRL